MVRNTIIKYLQKNLLFFMLQLITVINGLHKKGKDNNIRK